jgi:hypothetical protein
LPTGYDESSIKARLSGEMNFAPRPRATAPAKVPQLLIDIQSKLQQGYGPGYEHWAAVENLKRSARTLIYIQESGIESYEKLEQKCSDACGDAMVLQRKIRDIDDEQARINELQKQIGTYGKTRETYRTYNSIKKPKYKTAFYEANRADIVLHQSAKTFFNKLGYGKGDKKKLPSINQLREQWAALEKQKRPLCSEYKVVNKKFHDLCTAKSNAYNMLGLNKSHSASRDYGAR